MQDPKKIEARLKKTLKQQNLYTAALDMGITLCAYCFCIMDSSFSELKDSGVTIIELTRENNQKRNVNPATRAFFDAAEATRKALKELGLTLSTLISSDDDPVNELIDNVNKTKE